MYICKCASMFCVRTRKKWNKEGIYNYNSFPCAKNGTWKKLLSIIPPCAKNGTRKEFLIIILPCAKFIIQPFLLAPKWNKERIVPCANLCNNNSFELF